MIREVLNMMNDVEVLMMDGCTRNEAEKHLKNGTTVYEDLEEKLDIYIKEWQSMPVDEEFVNDVKEMIETKKPMKDWGIVEMDGNTYYIEYAL